MKKLSVYQILSLLLVVQLILVKLLSYFPDAIEKYYAHGIYPFISKLFRIIFGWLPFSIGDVLYFFIGLTLIIGIIKWIKNTLKYKIQQLFTFGAYLSVFYFLFHFLWAMNYHRNSLYTSLELEKTPYNLAELTQVTNRLLEHVKDTQMKLVNHDTLPVIIPYSKNEILSKTASAYDNLSTIYPEYQYQHISLKKSLFSLPLSYMGFSGYLNPLSGEAQVNYKVPKINLPAISCHEVAHQIGIASESEANFIGFIAATNYNDLYFKYAAYVKALRFSIAGLYFLDEEKANEFIEKIPKGVIKNIEESQAFWLSYQNELEPFFKLFYDNYLKANQQKDGMKSYNKMVDLLVAYHLKYGI